MSGRLAGMSALAVAATVAATALALPPEAAAVAKRSAGEAQRGCLWPKRDCYPPARLWYRVSIAVKASQRGEGALAAPPSPDWSGREHSWTASSRWTLAGNAAVILTLGCVEFLNRPAEPFLVKRRIDGKRRTIGGCAANAPDEFRPSVSFAAAATGEATSFERRDQVGAFEDYRDGRGCDSFEESASLISVQPLLGQISTMSALTEGLWISADPTAPEATVHYSQTPHGCRRPGGEPYTHPGFEADGGFHPSDHLFAEYPLEGFYVSGDWVSIWNLLRFPLRPGNFGEHYIIQRVVGAGEIDPSSVPPPPSPIAAGYGERDYSFTLRLEPCPNKGRDPERC